MPKNWGGVLEVGAFDGTYPNWPNIEVFLSSGGTEPFKKRSILK